MQWGLLHLSLPLWLRSRGLKVLSRGTGRHDHGDIWGSWWATVRVRIHVTVVSDTGWGESGREDGPRGDWRDCGVGTQVISGRWEVAEPAEGCKGIVEFDAVMVGHQKLGCQPNWEKGCHESFSLVDDGKFVDHEEDRVHVRHRDRCVVNEGRNGCDIRDIERMGRHLVKPTPEHGRFRELGWMRRVGISHIVGDGGGMRTRRMHSCCLMSSHQVR